MIDKNWQGIPPDANRVEQEIVRLNDAVDEFAAEMKAKLEQKAREGWSGWDSPGAKDKIYHAMLAQGAGIPFAVGQEVDIANFAMMLWLWNQGRTNTIPQGEACA